MRTLRLSLLLFVLLAAPLSVRAAELVMAEQAGCSWCEAWDAEIGVVYHKTREGRIAPLRRVNIHDPLPADLAFIRGLAFTPTFVLVEGGREIGRINGYPGEDFFWGLLQELIKQLPPRGNARAGDRAAVPPPDAPGPTATRG